MKLKTRKNKVEMDRFDKAVGWVLLLEKANS